MVATRRLSLTYPPHLIKEPVIYRVAKECNLVPNIRKARVTDTTGEVILDFQGEEADLERGITYLTRHGITVEEVREKS
ncbi:MAG: NIL domain-containing protein [candidate division NC10 bacterium]|nr:ferredoxin [candidate division NC10 bacterium]MCH7897704.1 NIL domain-containing protein [candidate division NC10 bacterium]